MSNAAAWSLLLVAGLFEVAWAVGLKYTQGFTRFWPSVGTILAIGLSMGLLGVAARQLPIGTAYAVWTGIGVFGTAVFGMWILGESTAVLRLISLTFILIGIVGLKLSTQV